ncbi:glycine--tRNA ligase [Erysipelotrichaceae bacterium OttesenSCG-928-M19]|nr:glycine--tRNA ligase [Erysipelotrichaceae bacterium OttesenSCG-928-M19]
MKKMDEIVNYCKENGFMYPGSQIYGGLANAWDYGPLGIELKRNIQNIWWQKFVQESPYNVGLDAAILMNPQVWVASGHVGGFSDPLMDCKECKNRFRADHLIEDNSNENPAGWSNEKMEQYIKDNNLKCPNCGASNFSEIKEFELMFKTQQGVISNEGSDIYLRPETAQGIFVNFKNVVRTTRRKLPLGIAQVGKAFRNEITPGNFIFRTREFEQMELEFFCKPGTDMEWFEYWKKYCMDWLLKYGLTADNLVYRDHEASELSHYSAGTVDIEYQFPFGQSELWGIANRTDYDLKAHQVASKESMEYHDPLTNEKYIPYVIEPSLGLNRVLLAFICDALVHDEERGDILKIHPDLAPYKICVMPLQKQQNEQAFTIYQALAKKYMVEFEASGNIGKRYKRQDLIGTPYCVTIDFDTENDDCVTIRDRDTTEQVRVKIAELENYFLDKFNL